VIVLNGDVLTDFDLGKIIEFHIDRRASATIALRAVQRPHAFGVLAAESDGRVTAWREPTEEEKKRAASGQAEQAEGTDFINAGIYVLEPEFVSRIPTGRFVSIERETYQYAIAEGLRVFATAPPGFWLDIGNPRQYLAANQAVLSGAVQTEVAFSAFGPSVMLEPLAKVDAMTAVGPGTVIGAGAVIERSVLLEDIRVGSGARIHEAIVDAGAVIPPDTALETGSVITGESYPADPPPSAMAL
jgi:NDP-sugar pyrophosphorylase family protein